MKTVMVDLTGLSVGHLFVKKRAENRTYPSGNICICYVVKCELCQREYVKTYSAILCAINAKKKNAACRPCRSRLGKTKKASHCAISLFKTMKEMGKIGDGITLDRFVNGIPDRPNKRALLSIVDESKPLSPENVEWKDKHDPDLKTPRHNQILLTVAGVTRNMSQWARALGVTRQAVESRVKRGAWPPKEIV